MKTVIIMDTNGHAWEFPGMTPDEWTQIKPSILNSKETGVAVGIKDQYGNEVLFLPGAILIAQYREMEGTQAETPPPVPASEVVDGNV